MSEPARDVPTEHELLARLLALSPDEAARVRAETPPRRRPRRQVGPVADYGDD